MEIKTRGIVIRTFKYGESSAISHIYTEHAGLLSFLVPSAYKNKGKVRISHLQPLNSVEIIFRQNRTVQLHRLLDIRCTLSPELSGFRRQAFGLILTEILQQTLREHEINEALFRYLHDEALPGLNSDIHAWQLPFVMLNVLHHYGCAPNTDTYAPGSFLDLQNGVFLNSLIPLNHIAEPEISELIYEMLTRGILHLNPDQVKLRKLTDELVRYYRYHIRSEFELQSREVLLAMK